MFLSTLTLFSFFVGLIGASDSGNFHKGSILPHKRYGKIFLSHFGGSENYLSFNFWMICGFVFSAVSDWPHVRSSFGKWNQIMTGEVQPMKFNNDIIFH